jgi:hypothetical protein
MKKLLFSLTLSFTLLSGCAVVAPLKQTSSGQAEATFAGKNVEEVKSLIMARCSSRGLPILDTGSNHVICGRQNTGVSGAFMQAMTTGVYGTTPMTNVRFNLFFINGETNVTTQIYMTSSNAFGQTQVIPLSNQSDINTIQNGLFEMGGR